MANKQEKNNPDDSVTYQIRVESHLKPDWAHQFEDMRLEHEETGNTVLSCSQMDQSGLYGLLKKIRDSGLVLISVERIKADKT